MKKRVRKWRLIEEENDKKQWKLLKIKNDRDIKERAKHFEKLTNIAKNNQKTRK